MSPKKWPIKTQLIERNLIPSRHPKWSPFGGEVSRKLDVLRYNPKFRKNLLETEIIVNERGEFKILQNTYMAFQVCWLLQNSIPMPPIMFQVKCKSKQKNKTHWNKMHQIMFKKCDFIEKTVLTWKLYPSHLIQWLHLLLWNILD